MSQTTRTWLNDEGPEPAATVSAPPTPVRGNIVMPDRGPVVNPPPKDGNTAKAPDNAQDTGNDAHPDPAGPRIPRWQLPRCQRYNGLQHQGWQATTKSSRPKVVNVGDRTAHKRGSEDRLEVAQAQQVSLKVLSTLDHTNTKHEKFASKR
ncbi:MAG: hypothetical protein Q9211_004616, partial [Gyalolechia sp. 1 TL-2023]